MSGGVRGWTECFSRHEMARGGMLQALLKQTAGCHPQVLLFSKIFAGTTSATDPESLLGEPLRRTGFGGFNSVVCSYISKQSP